ncbi:sensor histidine kinase [Mycobacterium haemophilum]|uniref:histidine kinase n=1 Tax=Mycobacterium haemophilum TaxID=29311 RepID=A0A0I9TF32_9MYCO|nr:HAMP domain-containing sensor histidine kinase [Mycobacterium haemophilum]AKN16068.1 ATP-binding protein [Mycobacterium haemophilum DSM 44634]KLO26800.1 ATP-binding protein [Mycobacterium haemophilum]KLO38407.1 ATP-binding protein [Mycobacterium haemophilum]KLO44741.1 ATP-binding protein [Mycobacterium haemophilum]KLO56084.1 ATP-binding protein [Mycobacterium haemophilum]
MAQQLRRGMPLRVGLVAATLALVACGLVTSGVAVTSILRHSLVSRIDSTLLDASRSWAQAPRRPGTGPPYAGPDPGRPPSKFYVRGIGADGSTFTAINDRNAEPALPSNNDVGPNPTTLRSVSGSDIQWRAVSVRGPHGLTTVAIDLSDVQHTVRSLVWSQFGIGVAVLVVVGIAGYAVVHRSLRPLAEVEQTAAAIAAGQLDRRVPERDPRTEVGRLSLALNGMLTQIQEALASSESSAETARGSEDRMRRFITDASHELRTPLTTIRGFAELYRQGAARDVAMLMSRIESEASRMGLLVDDLLLLARLDVQRPLEHRRVDLLALASDAVHDAQAIDPNRTITMEVFDGPGTPEVHGDEPRIRQVLSNLVANALQHTPEGADVTVRVGTDGGNAVLEVADQGPGMSQEDALRVFERFYRTDSSRARASGGTGLGLSIVDSLVRAHGGVVTVTTAPGQGCCFRVTLPRVSDVPAHV